jgi:hypothetical protein
MIVSRSGRLHVVETVGVSQVDAEALVQAMAFAQGPRQRARRQLGPWAVTTKLGVTGSAAV